MYKKLKEFADAKGWTINKKNISGEVNGYLFTATDSQGFVYFLAPMPGLLDTYKGEILGHLKTNKKRLNLVESRFSNDTLILKVKENLRTKIESYDMLLNEVINYFESKGLQNKNNCIFCGKPDALTRVYIDDVCYKAHDDCYHHACNEVSEATEAYNEENKNYFPGFVGALIGGLICSIPWILVEVFANRIAAVLALLIGIGSYKAYTLCRGKLGPLTRWIVAFCSIVCVFFAEASTVVIEMMQNHVPVTSDNIELLFQHDEFVSAIRHNLILGLIMVFIALVPIFKSLNGNAKNVMPKIEKNI